MICCTSSSSRCALALALAVSLGGCAGTRAKAGLPRAAPAKLALFPLLNLSGGMAPVREVGRALEQSLRLHGIELVDADAQEQFLARHRIRYTGGIDREGAEAAGAELGASGVLLASLDLYQAGVPPSVALTLRLVSADGAAKVLWIDGAGRTGDDAPGLFDLGLVNDATALQADLMDRLSTSLAAFLDHRKASAGCAGGGRFAPRASFRSTALDPKASYTVAVLPFLNESTRRNAGEVLANTFLRELHTAAGLRVVEPGLVRDEMLRFRIILEGGVSLDNARLMLELLQADLVLTGTVLAYDDAIGGGNPRVHFTAVLLDRKNNEVVWQSTSHGLGDDGVFFFEQGKIGTANELACRLVKGAVDRMLEKRAN